MSDAARIFPIRTIRPQQDIAGHSEQFISCSRCPATDTVRITKSLGYPPEALVKRFAGRGWSMGSVRAKDVCPECMKQARLKRIKPLNNVVPITPEPEPEEIMVANPNPPVAISDPVLRKPSREDNRNIMDSLNIHYDENRKCYGRGESDKTIAAKLNIPWAWVSKIREEFFGPAGSEDTYQILEAMENIRGEFMNAKLELRKISEDANKRIAEFQTVKTASEARIKRFDDQLKALEKDVEKVIARG